MLRRSGFAAGIKAEELTADTLPQLTAWLSAQEKPLEEAHFAARQNTAALQKEQAVKRAELDAVSGGKWVYPHGDAATRVRDAVNAELKSRGMQPDAKIFCELLNVEDESWQDCVEACLGDRRFDILCAARPLRSRQKRLCGSEGQGRPHQPAGHPGHPQGQPPRRQVRPGQPCRAGEQRKPAGCTVCPDHSGPHRLLRHPRYAGTASRQRHPRPSAPPSLPAGTAAHSPAVYRSGRTPRPHRGAGGRAGSSGESARAAAQTEQNLKAAYNQYQTLLRGTALDELAALWDARAALTAAQNAVTEQEAKLTECRENPLLQQLYKEEEAREAAWETARAAVEQTGGDIRVCQKQIASCEAEQKKAGETAQQSADAARSFFAAHPLVEPLARTRMLALAPADKPRAAAQAAEKAQAKLDDALAVYLTGTLEPAQKAYNEHYVCDYPLGLAGLDQYRAQHESLVRIDLERYAARLEQAQRDCKDRFRKDILFRMKDDIFNARRQFRELNKVMEQLTYGEEVYRFELEPSRDPQLAAFYQVIVDKGNQQMTEGDSLDNLAATADPAYERQVDELMEKSWRMWTRTPAPGRRAAPAA